MKTLERYSRTLVTALDRFIDDGLNKVNGVNKPFKAIQRTDDFKAFEASFADGIGKQGDWASQNAPELLISAGAADNLQPLTPDQEMKLRGLVRQQMPTLDTYVSETDIFLAIKTFFEYGVVQQYKRWGFLAKDAVVFTLSNTYYIEQLKARANYLLQQSALDQTTIDQIVSTISSNRLDGMTNQEVASVLADTFDELSTARANMIARTEAANSMGNANLASATENGAQTHYWVCAGAHPDETCQANEDDGEIPINQAFNSGDMSEPAHPNCECYTQAGEIDLDSIELWTGE